MYKHSVIRRRGEEEITIWVDNSFTESRPEPNPSLADRTVHTKHPYNYWGGSNREQCFRVKHHGDTGPNAPCTGGIREIKNWVRYSGKAFLRVFTDASYRQQTTVVISSWLRPQLLGAHSWWQELIQTAMDVSEPRDSTKLMRVDLHKWEMSIFMISLKRAWTDTP